MSAAWQRWCVALLLVWVVPQLWICPDRAQAQTIDDTGCWLALFARGDIGHKNSTNQFKWWFDGHARFFDDAGGPAANAAATASATSRKRWGPSPWRRGRSWTTSFS